MTRVFSHRKSDQERLTKMSTTAEAFDDVTRAQRMVHAIARSYYTENKKGALRRAARQIGQSYRQTKRLADGDRKVIPSWLMSRLAEVSALYNATCEALDESARQKIEANDEASEKRRRQRSCVDGEGDRPDIGLVEHEGEEIDTQLND